MFRTIRCRARLTLHRKSPPCLTAKRQQSALSPSTLDHGYKLPPARLANPFVSDLAYQRVLAWYLPSEVFAKITPDLKQFGDEAISSHTDELIANAETYPPSVKKRDVWNNLYPHDRLNTSHGWRALGAWGIQNGVVARGYEAEYGPHRRIVQHAFNYIYSASSAVYSCPVSMTSGAARLFRLQCETLQDKPKHPFHEIYRRLTTRNVEERWISSQWMTERPGGSDVQNSESQAVYSPPDSDGADTGHIGRGDWLISGYKYFCSATDCDIALMLAKTESGKLSLFVAPTKLTDIDPVTGEKRAITNGIRFHRLKTKFGTKPLPTAELELSNVRAWLVGPLDRGIPTIATLLNVTRTHNFITALSCWRRGMSIAKNFARQRTTLDQSLWQFPMHLRLLARMETKFRGLLNLAYFTTSLLSYIDYGHPSPSLSAAPSRSPLPKSGHQTTVMLRALTATSKAVICKLSCIALQECQEAMGGVGYMDEAGEPQYNISRLYRDTAANMTWEGTTNVLSSEVVRHLVNKDHLEVVADWARNAISGIDSGDMRGKLDEAWSTLSAKLRDGKDNMSALLAEGREMMFTFAWVVSGVLLAHDAQRDGDQVAVAVAQRWILQGEGVDGFGCSDVIVPGLETMRGRAGTVEDCMVVWDVDLPMGSATGHREVAAKVAM
ncbi:Putative adaptive response protein AidB [Septoria linicola]|uniref:Adaptive response protein AidB n=1 Tax=Septoria linicola TaxID=215465 RepID=A0A9Q9EIW4_9PEZI|nr:putative adaptive response protein AidB [Septoria linicola]USW52440.1 Putative adaptive response protein AidB [Septoria linicola]